MDRFAFAALLVLLVASAPRLAVYHRATPVRVVPVAVARGERTILEPPASLAGVGGDLPGLGHRTRAFARSGAARRMAPAGGRVEWYLRYSVDSVRFDRSRLVAVTAGRASGRGGR